MKPTVFIPLAAAALLAAVCTLVAQSPASRGETVPFVAFDVATIKPAAPGPGRYIRMQSAHRFFAKNYTVKGLIGAAYNLTPRAISGGPAWIDSEAFDILAGTPGQTQPGLDDQMSMLRKLLADRFQLVFHREPKEMSVYALSVAKGGAKLKPSTAAPDALPELVGVVYPDRVAVPARNATMAQFVSMLQRAVLDRPVLDQTGLAGKYDFDLEWKPDETQYGGQLPPPSPDSNKPDLFAALQLQLGLKLEGTRGTVQAIAIDIVSRPSEN